MTLNGLVCAQVPLRIYTHGGMASTIHCPLNGRALK